MALKHRQRTKFAEDLMKEFADNFIQVVAEKHPLDYPRTASYGAEFQDTTFVPKCNDPKVKKDQPCIDKKKKSILTHVTGEIESTSESKKLSLEEATSMVRKNMISKYSQKNKDGNKKFIKLVEAAKKERMEYEEKDESKSKKLKAATIKKKGGEVVIMPSFKEEKEEDCKDKKKERYADKFESKKK